METHETYLRSRPRRKREGPLVPDDELLLRVPGGKTFKVAVVEEVDLVVASMPRQAEKPPASERKRETARENGRLGGRPRTVREPTQPLPEEPEDDLPAIGRADLLPVTLMARAGVWEANPHGAANFGQLAIIPGFDADLAVLVTDDHVGERARSGSMCGISFEAAISDGHLVAVERFDDLGRRELTLRQLGIEADTARLSLLGGVPPQAAQLVWTKGAAKDLLARQAIPLDGGHLRILGRVTITSRIEG